MRLCQQSPSPREVERNIAVAVGAIEEGSDCDLVVLPELFIGGYQLDDVRALALRPDSPRLIPLREAASRRGSAVVVGFFEDYLGGVANSALCIDRDGSIAGVYRKTHLYARESEVFVLGDALQPIKLAQSSLGVMICFDLEFPEVARTLATRGADILVTISANMEPYGPDHAVFAQARALENCRSHVYVNRVGSESGFEFVGGTRVVDSAGQTLYKLARQPSFADIDVDAGAPRAGLDYLRQLRPTLYLAEISRQEK